MTSLSSMKTKIIKVFWTKERISWIKKKNNFIANTPKIRVVSRGVNKWMLEVIGGTIWKLLGRVMDFKWVKELIRCRGRSLGNFSCLLASKLKWSKILMLVLMKWIMEKLVINRSLYQILCPGILPK